MPGDATLQWAVVARDHELGIAAAALAARRAVIVVGQAGIGKTALSRAVVQRMGRAGRQLFGSQGLRSVGLGALLPVLDRSADTSDAFQVARTIIERIGRDDRVLLVDDAQWLDDASAAVIRMIVADGSVPVCLTVRTGEPVPADVTAIWKDHDAERIELEPLGRDDVRTIVESAIGGQVASSAIARLLDLSRGIPLHLRHLVESAVNTSALAQVSGVWRLDGAFQPPSGLTEVLLHRLDSLSVDERAVADLLACAESLGLTELIELCGEPAVHAAIVGELVLVADSERRRIARLGHPLYGEALVRAMSSTTRRDLFGRLAESLQRRGVRRRGDRLRLVAMQREAGHVDDDVLRAALDDVDVLRDPGALRQLAREVPDSSKVQVHLAKVLLERGRLDEGEQASLRAIEIATDDDDLRVATMAHANHLTMRRGALDEAVTLMNGLIERLTDPETLLDAEVGRLMISTHGGRFGDTLGFADQLRERDLDDGSVVRVGHIQGLMMPWCGRSDEVDGVQRTTLAAFRAGQAKGFFLGHPSCSIEEPMMFAQFELGDLEAADRTAARLIDEWVQADQDFGTGPGLMVRGRVALMRGRFDEAERMFRDGEAVAVASSDPSSAEWARGGRAIACAWRGDRDGAVAAAAEIEATLPNHPSIRCDLTMRGRAWGAAADGRLSIAQRILGEAADEACDYGLIAVEAWVRHDLAGLGEARSQVDRLDALVRRCDGPLPALFADHARALALDDADVLLDVAERFGDIDFVTFAARCADDAVRVADESGSRRTLGAARRVAATYWSRTDRRLAAVLPPSVQRLTSRELEIATMAARGSSAREIADALYLSARTVENHLQRAYEKLGVRTRSELAAVLG